MTDEVTCLTCGKVHPLTESELVFGLPDEIFALSKEDRSARCHISDDICALDQQRFFVRGLLPLPVHGRAQVYRVGLWAEISAEVFRRILALWSDPAQSDEPRLPGILANQLPLIEEASAGLPVLIQLTGPKMRPEFYVQSVDHPLHTEQTNGIDEHRALEYSDRSRRPSS
jgi:hypothetical protein